MEALDSPLPPSTPHPVVRLVLDASGALLGLERWLIAGLMTLLILLVLLNVVTRYSGMPLYWVDEASVYAVVWLTFIGASAMTRLRMDFAVTMLTDKLGPRSARVAKVIATSGVLALRARASTPRNTRPSHSTSSTPSTRRRWNGRCGCCS